MASENVFNAAVSERAEFRLDAMLKQLTEDADTFEDFEQVADNINAAKRLVRGDPDRAAEYLQFSARLIRMARYVYERHRTG